MKTFFSVGMLLCSLAVATTALAADIGKVVALRGGATIERESATLSAQLNAPIRQSDAVNTAAAARIKLLFVDDSVLTLAENSRLVVREFIEGRGDRGKSIYNLLDGKLRAVVGRTEFEVETPSAVAAARGTVIYFDVGTAGNNTFTLVLCLEGTVDVRSTAAEVPGIVNLTPGTFVVVTGSEALPPPAPAPGPLLDQARLVVSSSDSSAQPQDGQVSGGGDGSGGDGSGGDGSGNDGQGSAANISLSPDGLTSPVPVLPPIDQQPLQQPKRVDINISIPQ